VPFLRDDEYIILLDVPRANGQMMTVDQLKAFADCGIRTALWSGTFWDNWEVKPSEYNWAYFDNHLKRMFSAGMKTIIPLWFMQSQNYQSSYYVMKQRTGGPRLGAFSPWCKEAQDLATISMTAIVDRYASDDVLFTVGQHQGNERVLYNAPAYYDANALADWQREHDGQPDHTTPEGAEWLRQSYIQLLNTYQAIFVKQPSHELWYALSRYKATVPGYLCAGCNWIDDYLEDWIINLNPSAIHHVNYNYFPYGEAFYPIIQAEHERHGVLEWVGPEYCEGLRSGNGRLAAEHGHRGLILGPLHAYTGHNEIEPWMLDEVRKAMRVFEQREAVAA
jgi:hypothetical protein